MKKRMVFTSIVALALAAFLVVHAASSVPTVRTLGGPTKTTPRDLPIIKMPNDLLALPTISFDYEQNTSQGKAGKPPQQPANKLAVVIGIADYTGTEYDLWHSDEDAREMANALTANYGFPKNKVKLLLNRKATAYAIVSAIDWLVVNADSNSTVVFFYSGHGFQIAESEGWDSDIENDGYDEGIVSYDFYGITDGFLKDGFASLESQKVALCFGSCNSGGMFDDINDLQKEGRVIASACMAKEYAYDYLLLGNTLWGKYFVDEGLLQGLADLEGSDSVEEAHSYAYPKVIILQPESQPQIYDGYSGDLVP